MAVSDHSMPVRNRLLAALPPDSLAQLWPKLEAVELPLRTILHELVQSHLLRLLSGDWLRFHAGIYGGW